MTAASTTIRRYPEMTPIVESTLVTVCGRFGVTGGRDYDNVEVVAQALQHLPAHAVLVHGGATGADTLCARLWTEQGWPVEPHPADWMKYGKIAGPIRNQEMVDSGLDLLVAFPGGAGTADMVRRAELAGVKVIFAEGDVEVPS